MERDGFPFLSGKCVFHKDNIHILHNLRGSLRQMRLDSDDWGAWLPADARNRREEAEEARKLVTLLTQFGVLRSLFT